jgi:hypothetical protein
MEASDSPPSAVHGREVENKSRFEIEVEVQVTRLTVKGSPSAEDIATVADAAKRLRPSEPTGVSRPVGIDTLATQQFSGRGSDNQLSTEPTDACATVSQAAGSHTAEKQTILRHADNSKAVTNGEDKPRVIARLKRVGAATLGIARDVVAELIARVAGHWFRLPP